MLADEGLEKSLGKNWHHKAKQTPRVWRRQVCADKGPGKGRVAFMDRDNGVGEASKQIVVEFKKLHDECREAGEPWEAGDTEETLQTAIDAINTQRTLAGQQTRFASYQLGWVEVQGRTPFGHKGYGNWQPRGPNSRRRRGDCL